MEWKSNAKRGQLVDEGTIFESQCGVVIHRIVHCPGWYLSCADLRINDQKLAAESFDGAVEEAKQIVRSRVNAICERFLPFAESPSDNKFVTWFSRT